MTTNNTKRECPPPALFDGLDGIKCAIIDGELWLSVIDMAKRMGDHTNYSRSLDTPIFKHELFMMKKQEVAGYRKKPKHVLMLCERGAMVYIAIKANTSEKARALLISATLNGLNPVRPNEPSLPDAECAISDTA